MRVRFFFSGQIPDDAAWTKLRYINLNNNSFNGTISETFFSKENLTNIYFTNNTLSGTIPSNYGSAFALRDLWLNGNELTGEWRLALLDFARISIIEHHS